MKRIIVLAACSVLVVGGCGSDDDKSSNEPATTATNPAGGQPNLPQGSEPVELDPADFTTRIDNPYWPLTPGSKWVYRGTEGGGNQRVVVTVTNRTRDIAGVTARVVKDVVSEDGKLVEVTDDWYAQDTHGNVWYMGEDTKEYENGKVSTTAGSWEHGVDGAQAGIIMPADPRPGVKYRQEYYKGEAEDRGEILSVNATAKVPFGTFENCVKTEDTTPLEPDVVENKYYAKNVGLVLKISVSGGSKEELIDYTKGS
jgi:hypothetical protein